MNCPKCGAEVPEGARFCEVDGTRLGPPEPAAASVTNCRCGAGPDMCDNEGYCRSCGRSWPKPERDRKEVSLSNGVAGVTDVGKRHDRNEDDFAIALEQIEGETATVLIVCDGLSSAYRSDEASAAAAATACNTLRQGLRAGRADWETLMREAIAQANQTVQSLSADLAGHKDPPETTIVAAIAIAGRGVVAWVGDSRAYLIGPAGAKQLTHDHSWTNEMIAAGRMTVEEAKVSPNAHAITRCLGLDVEMSQPSTASFTLEPGEGLLICSDGLWNYAETETEIGRLLSVLPMGNEGAPARLPTGTDALSACRALTGFALDCGGRDNITVVLAWPAAEGIHA